MLLFNDLNIQTGKVQPQIGEVGGVEESEDILT